MIGRGSGHTARIRRGRQNGAAIESRWSSSSNGLTFSSLRQGHTLSRAAETINPRSSAAYRNMRNVDYDSDSEDGDSSSHGTDGNNNDDDDDDDGKDNDNHLQLNDQAQNTDAASSIVTPINTTQRSDADNDRPPTPWGDNCTAKKNIHIALNDPTDDIHLHIGTFTPDDFSEINFKSIWEIYAPRYKMSRFRENFKAVLRHFHNKTGHFKSDISSKTEPWTSRTKRSVGWQLLHDLLMVDKSKSELSDMTPQEIWASNDKFKCYPFEDFRKYLKDMLKITEKERAGVRNDLESFAKDCHNFPENEVTDRGEPFWYRSPAKKALAEDVKSGLAYTLKPQVLRETNEEYKKFTLKTFRQHVHQEKEKQRAAPFWRMKRNIAARYQIEKEQKDMRCQWMENRINQVVNDTSDILRDVHI